jgi:hypothetical protein
MEMRLAFLPSYLYYPDSIWIFNDKIVGSIVATIDWISLGIATTTSRTAALDEKNNKDEGNMWPNHFNCVGDVEGFDSVNRFDSIGVIVGHYNFASTHCRARLFSIQRIFSYRQLESEPIQFESSNANQPVAKK